MAGTGAAALHYEMTTVSASAPLLPKFAAVHAYPSDMAQNFWGAIVAWTACFLCTVAISVCTAPKPTDELRGLVYGVTPHDAEHLHAWYLRPGVLAVVILVLTAALNIVFW